MRNLLSPILILVAIGISAATEPAKPTAAAVLAELDRMLDLPLWPGFEPRRIPVAIYDGERTILARHPSPPPEFKREGDIWTYLGRHPQMRANTSVDLGGVSTATVLMDPGSVTSPREWAAILIHESFHVFQRQRHATWQGDEGQLFLYPMDDAGPLGARRLETEALRRALAAKDPKEAACWARRALDMRRERFSALPPGSVAYERGTELNEGLASYLQNLALGKIDGPELPVSEYSAEDVRTRIYAVGPALAALLDRFDPAWRRALEEGRAASLDESLAASLQGKATAACGFTPDESAAARERAKQDAQRLVQERSGRREAFIGRTGWKLEILAAPSRPLWPQGFDPWNVSLVAKGEILHGRWLKLGNDDSTLEVLDRQSLTEGAGEHPLFNGVRKLTVTGLAGEPAMRNEGDFLVIDAEGVTARLKGGAVEKEDRSSG